jgi:hypothetical protein
VALLWGEREKWWFSGRNALIATFIIAYFANPVKSADFAP